MAAVSLDLSPDELDRLADALAERVAERLAERVSRSNGSAGRWMTSREAAEYIGRSVSALHKLTASRAVPFRQDAPGARCYFDSRELDEWMASGGG